MSMISLASSRFVIFSKNAGGYQDASYMATIMPLMVSCTLSQSTLKDSIFHMTTSLVSIFK